MPRRASVAAAAPAAAKVRGAALPATAVPDRLRRKPGGCACGGGCPRCEGAVRSPPAIRRAPAAPRLQRKLVVKSETRPDDPLARKVKSAKFRKRFFRHVESLLTDLCPDVEVKRGRQLAEVKPKKGALNCAQPGTVASGKNPAGCCCLCIMTHPAVPEWTIKATDAGPRTNSGTREVLIHPPGSFFAFGAFNAKGDLKILDDARILGHELCGHGALAQLGGHPSSLERRATSDAHDPTVKIENRIAKELGAGRDEMRGLAGSGIHRGESVAKITLDRFKGGRSKVPSRQLHRIDKAVAFIAKRNTWVDVIGHSNDVGKKSIKQRVSRDRALAVARILKKKLKKARVKMRIVKTFEGLPSEKPKTVRGRRFTRIAGVSDSQKLKGVPSGPKQRRVDILMSSRPAGAQRPIFKPGKLEKKVGPANPTTRNAALKSANPCVRLLVGTAWK